jgi:hypothetical protein
MTLTLLIHFLVPAQLIVFILMTLWQIFIGMYDDTQINVETQY